MVVQPRPCGSVFGKSDQFREFYVYGESYVIKFITSLKLTNHGTSGNFPIYKVYLSFSQARRPLLQFHQRHRRTPHTTNRAGEPNQERVSSILRPLQSFESEQKIRIRPPIS